MIRGWNLLRVSLGIRILILKSIGGQIILNSHWFLKDEEAMDWREGFPQLPLDKITSLRKGLEKLREKEFLGGLFLGLFFLRENEEKDDEF